MKRRIITSLFLTLLLIFFSCGPNNDRNSGNGSTTTGSYHASLVFPDNITRIETNAKALEGIDCEAEGIAVIRFAFFDEVDTPLVDDQFPCSDHHATVAGIPPGNNRRVMVTAENQGGEVLLQGEQRNITIRANQDTKGADIIMMSPALSNDLGMTFILIPADTFMMGSPATELDRDDDEIRHEVTLTQDFYMQTTEVTQGQWQAVMDENPSYSQNCGLDCPVEDVAWDDVQEFIARLNAQSTDGYTYRLPTEAEWEYACRAGTETRYYTGNSEADLDRAGWYDNNSGDQTHPVGQKEPNGFGLYDMHGNVWEWCSDWYGTYPTGSVTDPQGPSSGEYRVLRGGSWRSIGWSMRCAIRLGLVPAARHDFDGLRLVRGQ